MEREYAVINVEQDSRSEWSRHRTLDLARAAARRYRRRNPDTAAWVDHDGFDIEQHGAVIETVR